MSRRRNPKKPDFKREREKLLKSTKKDRKRRESNKKGEIERIKINGIGMIIMVPNMEFSSFKIYYYPHNKDEFTKTVQMITKFPKEVRPIAKAIMCAYESVIVSPSDFNITEKYLWDKQIYHFIHYDSVYYQHHNGKFSVKRKDGSIDHLTWSVQNFYITEKNQSKVS